MGISAQDLKTLSGLQAINAQFIHGFRALIFYYFLPLGKDSRSFYCKQWPVIYPSLQAGLKET